MFTQRIAQSSRSLSTASSSLHRTFTSSSAVYHKTPTLGDITPEGVESFNAKQRDFRQKMVELQKSASQSGANASSPPTSSPTGLHASSASTSSNVSSSSQSASLSAEPKKPESDKKQGMIKSLVYGTEAGREMDQEIEQSFSKVLARGKYVHSIVFHEVKPDKVAEYVELVGNWYPRMASMPENKVHLVGSWRTEVGECDTFVHIWEYQKYHGYHESLHSISKHPEFPEFDRKLKTLIKTKRTSLMQEFSFWPTTAPRQLGGLFELRSYTLHPGNLLEWETHWRKGLAARREVMEGVGAWFVQIGELNTVHHLWQFADLEERKVRREESWSVSGWADTVHKTVPLIQTMKSKILIPCSWSPIA